MCMNHAAVATLACALSTVLFYVMKLDACFFRFLFSFSLRHMIQDPRSEETALKRIFVDDPNLPWCEH